MSVSLSVCMEAGSLIQFYYPRHNFSCVVSRQVELRRVRVEKVVDFRDESPDGSYPMEPDLRRGKLLVVGLDLDKNAIRRFYVESMSGLRDATAMQADSLESLRQNVAVFSDEVVKIPPLGGGNQMAAQEALSNQEPAKATDDGRHEGDAMDAKREAMIGNCATATATRVIGYRLGLYDPDPESTRPIQYIGKLYKSMQEERILFSETIAEYNELAEKSKHAFLCLSVFQIER